MAKKTPHFKLVSTKGRSTAIRLARNPLGSGADAIIYRVADRRNMAAKIYHDPAKDPDRLDKINAMLANPPDMPPISNNGKSYIQIAWPTHTIKDKSGRFIGYTMPLVDLKRSTILENLLAKKTRQVMGLPEFYGERVTAAANLAAVVTALHACGHHIIDLKPVNINIYLDKFYIALLDCDGLSILGKDDKRYSAHQYTDGYIAPEALAQRKRPQELGEEQDRFALAVNLFQLLNRGIHPYQGVPRSNADIPTTNSGRIQHQLYAYGRKANPLFAPSPWSIHEYLEDDTRDLFDRAFGTNPKMRPSANQWKHHLRALGDPDGKQLKKCVQNDDHGMFSKGCGFCHVQGVAKQAALRKKKQRANNPKTTVKHATQPTSLRAAARLAGGVNQPFSALSLFRWPKTLICSLLICIAIILYFSLNPDIHSVIRRGDQKTFFSRAFYGEIDWSTLTFEDARHAMGHEEERMFCTIIKNIDSITYDAGILYDLLNEKRFQSAQAYLEKAKGLEYRYQLLVDLMETRSVELMNSFKKRLKMSREARYLFAEVFLRRNIPAVQQMLDCGADPNMVISVDNYQSIKERGRLWMSLGPRDGTPRYHIVEKLHAARGWIPNYTDAKTPGLAPAVRAIHRRYPSPYKVPGIRHIRHLEQAVEQFRTGKAFDQRDISWAFSRWKPGLVYQVHPLTIAVLYGDLQLTRVLLQAGAKLSNKIPNHASIFDLAPNKEIYQILKTQTGTSNGIEQALIADDPEVLTTALSKTKKVQDKGFQKDIWLAALSNGSLKCLDMLRQKWKKPRSITPVTSIIKAYQSGNPQLLAYHLKHIIPYDRTYSYQQLLKQYGRLYRKHGVYNDYQTLSGFAESKPKKLKIGDLLLRMAMEDQSWAMAFILEDHNAKWANLHLAVLAEDKTKITTLLRKNPGSIELRDAKGRTPLVLAAQYQCHISYATLMIFKPNFNTIDKNGLTPIMYAIEYGNEPMVRNLLERGARLTLNTDAKCTATLHKSQTAAALAEKVRDNNIPGVPDSMVAYTEQILNTHTMVKTAAGLANLPACK